jgi:cyclomaltodextrinase
LTHWASDSFFYHLYPLGFCGAPERNDFRSSPVPRLDKLYGWLDHLQRLGVNAVYLGPLFESSAHGYDTADFFLVDRRLGDNSTLAALSAELHRRDIRLVLDGVFHHVGREFWAFRDLREHGERSAYAAWFEGVSFAEGSPRGDAFTYHGWEGNFDLVKLALGNPEVRAHLFEAVAMWVRELGIDGLRLDVAYLLDRSFLEELGRFCRAIVPDFWLMGEVIHGDYRRWVAPGLLDSVTNYECYKGLYSSHNDGNYFEIAYALNRQFGEQGLYRGMPLYSFADNHDVNRVATNLREPAHLYPLYCLLFTMPGVPSVYYGSEWGIRGRRTDHDDRPLRPALELEKVVQEPPAPELPAAIARLAQLRHTTPALRFGEYRQLHVSHEQLVFLRSLGSPGGEAKLSSATGKAAPGENRRAREVIVAVNAADVAVRLDLALPAASGSRAGGGPAPAQEWVDLLNPPQRVAARSGSLELQLPPRWARVLSR